MKKGLVVGVAVGGLLYVMWRRRRAAGAPSEPAPAWQPPPPPPPAPVAEEPAAEEPAADEEVTEELEPEPEAEAEHEAELEAEHGLEAEHEHEAEPEPEPEAPEPVGEIAAPVTPPRREEPSLHHPGRRLPLTSSGFAARPRIHAFRGSDRPQAAQARISWPGTGGPASQKPKPLRLVPARSRPASLRRSR